MSVSDAEMARRAERARAVGLFRYGLVREAADPGLSARARGRLVRQLAAGEHEMLRRGIPLPLDGESRGKPLAQTARPDPTTSQRPMTPEESKRQRHTIKLRLDQILHSTRTPERPQRHRLSRLTDHEHDPSTSLGPASPTFPDHQESSAPTATACGHQPTDTLERNPASKIESRAHLLRHRWRLWLRHKRPGRSAKHGRPPPQP